MKENEYCFTVTSESGEEKACEVLAFIKREEENPIIIYTDFSTDDSGKINLFASELITEGGKTTLVEVKDIDNLPVVVEKMQEIWKKYQENDD